MVPKIYGLTGRTPLVQIPSFAKKMGVNAHLYCKLEYFNPAGSVKDRVAKSLILNAEKRGVLKKGGTIIEATSGNLGISLAAYGVPKGYRVILAMPRNMSRERRKLISAYGGETELTDPNLGMRGAIECAERLKTSMGGTILSQFTSPANVLAHYSGTGPEIYSQSGGNIDIFVAGVGTGGTITGVGRYLKKLRPQTEVYAVEPASSPVLSGGVASAHKIQGIGAGFVPPLFDKSVVDGIIPVDYKNAVAALYALARTEGFFAGISSGAALHAAVLLAANPKNAGKNIFVLLPDGGERYLSTL